MKGSVTQGGIPELLAAAAEELGVVAGELGKLEVETLVESVSQPLPDWFPGPGEELDEARRERILAALRARDWRICLELLALRGDEAARVFVAELAAVAPEERAPVLNPADQELLLRLGDPRSLAEIAAAAGASPAELGAAVAELRTRVAPSALGLLAEQFGDRVDLARWIAEASSADGAPGASEQERHELLVGDAGDLLLAPTQPLEVGANVFLRVVERSGPGERRTTRISLPGRVGDVPLRARWRLFFDPEDELRQLVAAGFDRTLLGLARVVAGSEASFTTLLDLLLPPRAGEITGQESWFEWPGRLPRLIGYSLRVEAVTE